MVCIYCCSKTQVTNSRLQKKQNSVWRRRKCSNCKAVFTSVESIDLGPSLLVAHTTTNLEPFQRDKLFVSIYDSLKHRKSALADATALTNTVISRVLSINQEAVITKEVLTKLTIDVLAKFDKIASVHYKAYYT